ncbi:hypothetical protein GQ607_012728 [Colletotrichum asianum]|uniref:Uncharacterized protein n=1 Tax=Colletotrichum asianum TaxID=702518 RepID=A0A8H3ZQE6_9PEZI|nr:hypothetical protein GQ607_012728 [Colletotrichum asianum]
MHSFGASSKTTIMTGLERPVRGRKCTPTPSPPYRHLVLLGLANGS